METELERDGKLHKLVEHCLMKDENRENSRRMLSCTALAAIHRELPGGVTHGYLFQNKGKGEKKSEDNARSRGSKMSIIFWKNTGDRKVYTE
mgnify:CR=1 FL=1